MKQTTLIPIMFIGFLVGCSSVQKIDVDDDLYKHVIRMDRDGSPLDVTTGKKIGIERFKKKQMREIKSAMEKFVDRGNGKESGTDRSIVIYVHGAPLFGDVEISESRDKLRSNYSGKLSTARPARAI